MYGLPPNTQLDFLKEKTLLQACFGAKRHSRFEEVSRELLRLLNRVVAEVHWTPEGSVTLIFDEGSAVHIYDDSTGYESYTIAGPSGLLVV